MSNQMEQITKDLVALLESAAAILAGLTPKNLTPEHIARTEDDLRQFKVSELIREIEHKLPVRPDDEKQLDAHRKLMRQHADQLNKKADLLNDELKRLKQVRTTLNLARLDPVIEAARSIVRPVFAFTAGLQD